nr:AtpZ/AtpI family protein [uncultured Cohaesibacter sp.]
MSGKKYTEVQGDPIQGNEDRKLDNRRETLDAELAKLREGQATKKRAQLESGQNNGLAMAWRLGSEFVAGVLVGTAVGWLLDEWLGIRPWGMIIFLLLGFLAGMLNLLRSAGKMPPPGA